ncbi:putative leucine-rich repeat-containing protein DDB_G0290503 [Prorops nasuta]|uniref:putative leucine-rich repeat-containing protein DDB_G0290503 n=1 Tax=Prorops nasuta TaxID=863751 RepID=UPI0034CF9DC4
MFSLVRFEPHEYYICESKNISSIDKTTKTCTVKYSNGGKYFGIFLQKNDNINRLKETKRKLEEDAKNQSKTKKTLESKYEKSKTKNATKNKQKNKLMIPKNNDKESTETAGSNMLESDKFSEIKIEEVIIEMDDITYDTEHINEIIGIKTESEFTQRGVSKSNEQTELIQDITSPLQINASDIKLEVINEDNASIEIDIDCKKNIQEDLIRAEAEVSMAKILENGNKANDMVNCNLILQCNDLSIDEIMKVIHTPDDTNYNAENIIEETDFKIESASVEEEASDLLEQTEIVQDITNPLENNLSNMLGATDENNAIAKISDDVLLNVSQLDDSIDLVDELKFTDLSLSEKEESLLQAVNDGEMNVSDEDFTATTRVMVEENCNTQLTSSPSNFEDENNQHKRKIIANVLNNIIAGAPNNNVLKLPEEAPKRHNCFYCNKLVVKIARHLEVRHSKEADVQAFLKLRKKSKERSILIADIRKKGDYNYNTNKTVNNGNLIVLRLPSKDKNRSTNDYIACANCKGHYMRSSIRHHFAKCTNYTFKGERSINILCKMVDGKLHESANKVVRKEIFPYIRDGPIKDVIRYDVLLVLYANTLTDKYSHDNFWVIRSKLRFSGRFLIAIKKIRNEIVDFASIYRPKYLKYCLKAASIVAGYNEDLKSFKAPSNILFLGNILKQIGKLLEMLYIAKKDNDKQKMTQNFNNLIAQGFQIMNKKALEAQIKRNRQKKVNLPSTNDIIKLNVFLEKKRISLYKKLQQKYTYNHWIFLSKICMIQLQLFNKRRQSEISKATISDFKSCQSIDKEQNVDMYNSLSKKCQEASNCYLRFTIQGKLEKTVTVLIHRNLQECINFLLQYRSKAGILQQNKYLFALPGFDKNRQHKHIRPCDLMIKISKQCSASSSDILQRTTLRKQIATMCTDLQLGEQEISDLVSYLRHSTKNHTKYDRQPLISRETWNMIQILESATPSLTSKNRNVELNNSDIINEIESRLAEEEIDDPFNLSEETSNHSENKTPIDGLNSRKKVNCRKRKAIDVGNKTQNKKVKYVTKGRKLRSSFQSESDYDDEDSENSEDNEQKRTINNTNISKPCIIRIRWTEEEKSVVEEAFQQHFENNTLPSLTDCNRLIKKYKSVFNIKRTGVHVKSYINNQNKKKSRILKTKSC